MIEKIVANGHGALPDPKFLAVHSTANPGATALNHVNYWKNNPTYAVHAVSDWKEAYHTVPYDRLCYQVGNGNYTCIGIEMCEATNYEDFIAGMEIAKLAIWQILHMKGWNVDDHVRSHLWFTENYGGSDHTDPIPYLTKWGKDWNWFINFLKVGNDVTYNFNDMEEDDMRFIYQPNGEGRLVYYDGVNTHPLNHPDEVTALQMAYKQCTGKDMPVFAFGSPEAPWATRFEQAIGRTY